MSKYELVLKECQSYIDNDLYHNENDIKNILNFNLKDLGDLLTREQEANLFARINLAKVKINELENDTETNDFAFWIDQLTQSKAILVNKNSGLVTSLVSSFASSYDDCSELESEANMALIKAINAFDISKGRKFSTYLTISIRNAVYKLISEKEKKRSFYYNDTERLNEISVDNSNSHLNDLRYMLENNRVKLNNRERIVIEERYLNGEKETLDNIGKKLGLSKERIRQIEFEAMKKMKKFLLTN